MKNTVSKQLLKESIDKKHDDFIPFAISTLGKPNGGQLMAEYAAKNYTKEEVQYLIDNTSELGNGLFSAAQKIQEGSSGQKSEETKAIEIRIVEKGLGFLKFCGSIGAIKQETRQRLMAEYMAGHYTAEELDFHVREDEKDGLPPELLQAALKIQKELAVA